MIHYLFGPLGIIISSVTKDLITFIVVLFIFLIGFSFQICCLFQSIEPPAVAQIKNETEIIDNSTALVSEIGDNEALTDYEDINLEERNCTIPEKKIRWPGGTWLPPDYKETDLEELKRRRKRSVMHAGKARKRVPRKSGGGGLFVISEDSIINNETTTSDYTPPIVTNEDPSTLVLLFTTLYFSMFALGGADILPVAKGSASWSWIVFQV